MKTFILIVTFLSPGQPSDKQVTPGFESMHACRMQARAVTQDKRTIKQNTTGVFTSPSGRVMAYCIGI